MPDTDDDEITALQQSVCVSINAIFSPPDPYQKIGLAENIHDKTLFPINGLRHPIEGGTTGWYIWRGEHLSSNDDFFKPYHCLHVHEHCPEIVPYLGLPPGWRFLIAPNYEDIWFDETLLKIDPIDETPPHP